MESAAAYGMPFEYVKQYVFPVRATNRRAAYAEKWWQYAEARPGMRKALQGKRRFIATPRVAKHRIFVWLPAEVLANDGTIVFARDDDYFFGVLHSKAHELWALRQGTSLEDRPRYTPTTTFETFPFPWPPGREPAETEDERVFAIAQAARDLNRLREGWLNPAGLIAQAQLNKRTLTNLYNALSHYRQQVKGKQRNPQQWDKEVGGLISLEEIEELDAIHQELDRAVLAAYGWPAGLSDEQILERLLALNGERAGDVG
jgi:type II restriction/modification system DNA methylase subunit YeeA